MDIEIPEPLWLKCEEIPPFFFAKLVPDQAVPQHMKDHLARNGRKRSDG